MPDMAQLWVAQLSESVSQAASTVSITAGVVLVLLKLASKGKLDISPIISAVATCIDAVAVWIRLPADLLRGATIRRGNRMDGSARQGMGDIGSVTTAQRCTCSRVEPAQKDHRNVVRQGSGGNELSTDRDTVRTPNGARTDVAWAKPG